MHKLALHHTLLALALALSFGAAGTATAATATGNMTMSGAITYAAPPASCTVSSPNVDVTYEVPYDSFTMLITKNTSVSVTCTNGTSYSLATAASSNGISFGGNSLVASILNNGKNIAMVPVSGVGNAAAQAIPLQVNLMNAGGETFRASTVGTVSGSIPLTVTY